jgi:hypothetical protein
MLNSSPLVLNLDPKEVFNTLSLAMTFLEALCALSEATLAIKLLTCSLSSCTIFSDMYYTELINGMYETEMRQNEVNREKICKWLE